MKVVLLDGYNLIYRAIYSRMNKGDHSTIFNFSLFKKVSKQNLAKLLGSVIFLSLPC